MNAPAPIGDGSIDAASPDGRAQAPSSEDRRARVLLGRVAEPGDQVLGRLLVRWGAAETLERIRSEVEPDSGVSADRTATYRRRLDGPDPDAVLQAAAEHGIRFVCPGEAGWPSQLDVLGPRRPTGLWVRGSGDLRLAAVRSIAVVGSRDASAYGAFVAADLALGLAERCWCVVSGAAFGIDVAAHRGALAAGTTVAVLANGVDVPYPRAHAAVLERIAATGAVVAELPPGARPTRYRFLERNRVIAALTRGTVVVEAAVRSGALRTAHEAVALGRHVMGLPGPVTSARSAGVHALIRDGATLVCDAAQVIENVAVVGEELAPEPSPAGYALADGGTPANRGVAGGGGLGGGGGGAPIGRPTDRLGSDLLRVLDALPADRACGPEEIACTAGLGPGAILAALGALEASGWVVRDGQGWRPSRRP